MGVLIARSINQAQLDKLERYYSEYYRDEFQVKILALKRARINDDGLKEVADNIPPDKKENYMYNIAYLDSAIACHMYASDYAARSLCRTIIEICVKTNLKHPLDKKLTEISKNIKLTSWPSDIKAIAEVIYDEGNRFVHLNPTEIDEIMKKYAEQVQGFEHHLEARTRDIPNLTSEQKEQQKCIDARAFSPTTTADTINSAISVIRREFLS